MTQRIPMRTIKDLGKKSAQDCTVAMARVFSLVEPDVEAAKTINSIAIGILLQVLGASLRSWEDDSLETFSKNEFGDIARGVVVALIVHIKGPENFAKALAEGEMLVEKIVEHIKKTHQGAPSSSSAP